MGKSNKNTNTYPEIVIDRLKLKYGVSKRFITMSIKGDRSSETSEQIKKDYSMVMSELTRMLEKI